MFPAAVFTVTVAVCFPGSVGLPVILPVTGSISIPSGRSSAVTVGSDFAVKPSPSDIVLPTANDFALVASFRVASENFSSFLSDDLLMNFAYTVVFFAGIVYVTFTSDKYGAVSGKMTYKGKGYSFKANYSEASSSRATFKPSIKIGSTTYKPAVTIEKLADGITVSQANGEQKGKFVFVAQKKPSLIKAKKALAGMVGKSYTFSKGYKNAGLTKSGDKLKVKFGETDVVKVSGQTKGKKVSFSTTVIYSGMEPGKKGDVYTAMVMLVDSTAKYYKSLVFTITVDPKTGKIVKVSKAFGEIE